MLAKLINEKCSNLIKIIKKKIVDLLKKKY